MLKLISTCAKMITYTVLVLVAGNSLHWRGQSLAEHIKYGMNLRTAYHLEDLRDWTTRLVYDAHQGAQKKTRSRKWERATSLNDLLEK